MKQLTAKILLLGAQGKLALIFIVIWISPTLDIITLIKEVPVVQLLSYCKNGVLRNKLVSHSLYALLVTLVNSQSNTRASATNFSNS